VSITIALAEGFDGENVELVAAGRTYLIRAARTSLLTGMADEVVVDAGEGPVEVMVRLVPAARADPKGADVPGPAPTPGPAWGRYDVPQGAVLVLNRSGDGLSGRVLPGPIGFA
jgi:hypothetical protein